MRPKNILFFSQGERHRLYIMALFLSAIAVFPNNVFAQPSVPYNNINFAFLPLSKLPVNSELPDPFLMFDGKRVRNSDEWLMQREYLKDMISYYEYGEAPPPPVWSATQTSIDTIYNGKAVDKRVTIFLDSVSLTIRMRLVYPLGVGPFPVVIKNDYSENSSSSIQEELVVNRGYALAVFNREDLCGDNSLSTGVYKVYPGYNWGNLRVWGWGTSRVIDFLETQSFIDSEKICATGQSRGGKAAMLAAIFDERIAVCVPSGSGCSGMDLLRVLSCGEDLKDIAGSFPYWFSLFRPDGTNAAPIFFSFRNNIYKLPFDQHFCRALIAPRAIMSTDGLGDAWACPSGTQSCYSAAQPVFDFLGVPQNNAIHFRDGGHSQNAEDWTALTDFCDKQFFGKTNGHDLLTTPITEPDSLIKWKAPDYKTCGDSGISDTSFSFQVHETMKLSSPANPVSWISANCSVATIDSSGVINGVSAGSAMIYARNADGCIFSVGRVRIKNYATSVSDLNHSQHDLVVFPNPAMQSVKISHNFPEGEKFMISLYDVRGKNIISREKVSCNNGQPFELDLTELSAGLYFICLTNSLGFWSSKIFKSE